MVFAKISQVAHYAPDQVVSMMIWLRSWIQVMNGSVVGQVSFGVTFQR